MQQFRRFLIPVVLVLVAGVVAVLMMRRPEGLAVETGVVARQAEFRSTVTASGEIVASRYADIGSSVMGKIVSLPVREGDRVKAGQVLARIDAVQARSTATGAEAQVRALEADLRATDEQVRAATADLVAADARAREAAQQATRRADLLKAGLLSAAEFETARATADAAAAQASSARAAVERARQGRDAAERRAAQARAQQTGAADLLDKTSVVSPIDGIVSRLRVREGEMVVIGIQNQPGTTLMTISDLGEIDAEVKVAEADVLRLALGQPAVVTLQALPDRTLSGRVVEIGASALPVTAGASAREFKVVVRIDTPEGGLRPGLTCDAEIVTSQRTNVLTVPLQSVVLRPGADGRERSGVFRVAEGRAVFTPVTTGVIGGLAIEVAGIDEGASLIVGPYQALRELQDGVAVLASVVTR